MGLPKFHHPSIFIHPPQLPIILGLKDQTILITAKVDVLKANPTSRTQVEAWKLDQESIKSVTAFGKRIQIMPRLDVIILNAAIFKFNYSTSSEINFKSSLQVNHLSRALLTLYLLPILQRTTRKLKPPYSYYKHHLKDEVVMNLVNPGTEGGRLVVDSVIVKGKDIHGKYLSKAKVVEVTSFIRGEEDKKLQSKL
ncbi:hypothetical protein N431DRAFT_550097 [Stipitochalara longipes BDJ]|nr:hypothetical protein N431DRAFT_550097 [Stipitochalara longipes BDJ]